MVPNSVQSLHLQNTITNRNPGVLWLLNHEPEGPFSQHKMLGKVESSLATLSHTLQTVASHAGGQTPEHGLREALSTLQCKCSVHMDFCDSHWASKRKIWHPAWHMLNKVLCRGLAGGATALGCPLRVSWRETACYRLSGKCQIRVSRDDITPVPPSVTQLLPTQGTSDFQSLRQSFLPAHPLTARRYSCALSISCKTCLLFVRVNNNPPFFSQDHFFPHCHNLLSRVESLKKNGSWI